LSITERFIKLHGGKIWVESEKGVGTTFFFRLPVAPPAPLGESFLRGVTPGWEYLQRTRLSKAPKSVVRPRFVVLETGNTLQRLLTRYWHETEIVPVADIEAATAELSRVPTQALLVNDVSLSRSMSHLAAAKTLPNDTPVITCVVSGTDELNDALDVSIRLVKPVSQDVLLNALDQLQVQQGTILIVDDEPDALHLFGRMLDASERKYRVLLARDGQEALNILQECHPDVILLDLVMPGLDGFQLLEFRSQNPELLRIPVIIISARDPAGQPIVSSSLATTRGGGLSVQQLLRSIEVLSKVLAPAGSIGDLMLTAEPAG
jgi:CheY-like chemotaxis protein